MQVAISDVTEGAGDKRREGPRSRVQAASATLGRKQGITSRGRRKVRKKRRVKEHPGF